MIQAKEISFGYDSVLVLRQLNLLVEEGRRLLLSGPSGGGKTTLMRLLCGLLKPQSGQIIAPERLGVVFQEDRLIPGLTALGNVELISNREQARNLLAELGLAEEAQSRPDALSGGQRRRVALARALACPSQALLLDEPLGALDLQLRRQMQQELKRLQKKLGISFVYITHDQEEALNMSDRIAVMKDGLFQQMGPPEEIYGSPKTAYVARFVGAANILHCHVDQVEGELVRFANAQGSGAFLARGRRFQPGEPVTLAIRGEQARAVKGLDRSAPGLLGVVKEKSFAGGLLRVTLELSGGGEFVCSRQGLDSDLTPGDQAKIVWEPDHACPVDQELSQSPAGKEGGAGES